MLQAMNSGHDGSLTTLSLIHIFGSIANLLDPLASGADFLRCHPRPRRETQGFAPVSYTHLLRKNIDATPADSTLESILFSLKVKKLIEFDTHGNVAIA